MGHLQRKLLRESTLLRVEEEVSEPMQRLAEIRSLEYFCVFFGLGAVVGCLFRFLKDTFLKLFFCFFMLLGLVWGMVGGWCFWLVFSLIGQNFFFARRFC